MAGKTVRRLLQYRGDLNHALETSRLASWTTKESEIGINGWNQSYKTDEVDNLLKVT